AQPEAGDRALVRARPRGGGPELAEPAAVPRADAAVTGRRLRWVRARRPAVHVRRRAATDRARERGRRVADHASLPVARTGAARLRGRPPCAGLREGRRHPLIRETDGEVGRGARLAVRDLSRGSVLAGGGGER